MPHMRDSESGFVHTCLHVTCLDSKNILDARKAILHINCLKDGVGGSDTSVFTLHLHVICGKK